jgi:hypothetical protein
MSSHRFEDKLAAHGLSLRRGAFHTLQINVGRRCNQTCRHCHVDAAPWRTETVGEDDARRIGAWIEEHRDSFNVTRMCRVLQVSRSGYCQWRTRAPSQRTLANAALDAQVAAIHAASRRSYGRNRIARGLRQQGLPVGHERVRQSLRRQGLRAVYNDPIA